MSDDDSSFRRMVDKARPSGRLPALDTKDGARSRLLRRWKQLRENLHEPPPKPKPPMFERSRYSGGSDEEDS